VTTFLVHVGSCKVDEVLRCLSDTKPAPLGVVWVHHFAPTGSIAHVCQICPGLVGVCWSYGLFPKDIFFASLKSSQPFTLQTKRTCSRNSMRPMKRPVDFGEGSLSKSQRSPHMMFCSTNKRLVSQVSS